MPPAHRRSSEVLESAMQTAVRDLLLERGYGAMTVERVAARAGVAKTVLYRRWPSKAEMVFEVVVHGRSISPPADHGVLADDVSALVGRVIALLSDPVVRAAMAGLLGDLQADQELLQRFQGRLIGAERAVVAEILDRAYQRGEVLAGIDVRDVHAQLLGTVFAWFYLLGGDPPADLQDRVTAALLALIGDRKPGGDGHRTT